MTDKNLEKLKSIAESLGVTNTPRATTTITPSAPIVGKEEALNKLNAIANSLPKVAPITPTYQSTPSQPETAPTAEAPTDTILPPKPTDYSKQKYSESNLVEDKYFAPIQDYMVARYGSHILDLDRNEVVSQFVNNQRGFAAGNSWRAGSEIMWLNSNSDNTENLGRAGEAYSLFENMQGLGGDTSWGEKGAIAWDYSRAALLDPTNLLGGIIGKVAGGVSSKVASRTAMWAAKRVFDKKVMEGMTREAALTVAKTALQKDAERVAAITAKKAIERKAIEQSAKTTIQRMTSPVVLKEAAIRGAIDGAVNAATDYVYQDAMLRTNVQDDYSISQTVISGAIGLVAGGALAMATNAGRGTAKIVSPTQFKTNPKGAKVLSQVMTQTPVAPPIPGKPSAVPMGTWLKDVANGVELKDQDSQFFITMMNGDSEKGLKGLTQILAEDGYAWVDRGEDDGITNFIGDAIKYADPQDAKKFMDDFTAATGITMAEGKALTIETFADTFKLKVRQSAQIMNALKQAADVLGRSPKEVKVKDFEDWVKFGDIDSTSKAGKWLGNQLGKVVNKDLPELQDHIITAMVSNLSTTQLNLQGYAHTTLLNSATDVTRAVLLGGWAGINLVLNPKEAKEAGITAMALVKNQVLKARHLLDTNASYDAFVEYAKVRPGTMGELTNMGLSPKDVANKFDPDKPLWSQGMGVVTDYLSGASLNPAQDNITKSLEFMVQLDKEIRMPLKSGGFGMSYNELMSKPDVHKYLLSEQYMKVEARAIDSTLRATYAKSFKDPKTSLGQIAGMIEDARKIPGIGMLVPFGKFFNNTVAMAYNMTAVGPIVAKIIGKDQRMTSEVAAKGLVAFGMFYEVAQEELKNINLGLAWNESIDPNSGEVMDYRYAFPYGAIKAGGRIIAHRIKNETPPPGLIAQVVDTYVGQLTRGLSSSNQSLTSVLSAIASGDVDQITQVLSDTLGTIPTQAASGLTRPLEPLNAIAGLIRKGGYYTPDRAQGMKMVNQSMRYIDQMYALATGGSVGPQKYNTTEGKPIPQPTRLISPYRTSNLTFTEKVLNTVGVEGWPYDMRSDSPEANNRYNQVFRDIVESGAQTLWNTPQFRSGNYQYQKSEKDKLFANAKEATLDYMNRLATNSGDSTWAQMIHITTAYSKEKIDYVSKDLGITNSIEDMSQEELYNLQGGLEVFDDALHRGD